MGNLLVEDLVHGLLEAYDAGASSASTRGRTTQCLGIISESEMLGVTANLLELIGKMEEDQALGS
jgi:hypothetical protein